MSTKNNLKPRTDQLIKVSNNPKTGTTLTELVETLEVFDPETKSVVRTTGKELKKSYYKNVKSTEESDAALNVVYQVVYPDDLNLKPAPGHYKSRGRPKKSKIQIEPPPSPQKPKIKIVSKTRSGREVKFPKYIENAFKKIEINDDLPPDSLDVKISDFVNYSEARDDDKSELRNKILDQPDLLQKKRRIAAQYRCPKCKKAYLGRNKILEHLKKNPTHGPMHQNEENNFEVWNYLVSVTQKCPSSERGQKFCQELSNLLHNLLLLTNALFKKLGSAANEVKIDKVLGNAIGLTPGSYYFDDNNLYKNVTVLKLMANNDFLHSIKSKTEDINLKSTILSSTSCDCGRRTGIDELFLKSMLISSESDNTAAKQVNRSKPIKQSVDTAGEKIKNICQVGDIKNFPRDEFLVSSPQNFLSVSECEIKNNLVNEPKTSGIEDSKKIYKVLHDSGGPVNNVANLNERELKQDQNFYKKVDIEDGHDVLHNFTEDEFFSSNINLATNFPVNDYDMKQPHDSQTDLTDNVMKQPYSVPTNLPNHGNADATQQEQKLLSPKIKIQSNILICPPRFFQKDSVESKSVIQNVHKNIINPDFMTDNSVLIPLPNMRHSVDELMLPVQPESSHILDNSSSSDEVMNVDQFVNERFRKITESDLEVTNGNSLNLELPGLDLFQFHTS